MSAYVEWRDRELYFMTYMKNFGIDPVDIGQWTIRTERILTEDDEEFDREYPIAWDRRVEA